MPFVVTGASGSLRVGGRVAATLTHWEARSGEQDTTITARLEEKDDYWLDSGGPYELRLVLSRSTWRWRNVSPALDATTLTARVTTPPEEL